MVGDLTYGGVKMPVHYGTKYGVERLAANWYVACHVGDDVYALDILKGYEFDGASIPRLLWRVCGHPMEIPRLAAALAHDWLYSAHLTDRATADAIYRAICRQMGLGAFRTAVEHRALRMFGGSAWSGHGADDENFARAHGALRKNGNTVKDSE